MGAAVARRRIAGGEVLALGGVADFLPIWLAQTRTGGAPMYRLPAPPSPMSRRRPEGAWTPAPACSRPGRRSVGSGIHGDESDEVPDAVLGVGPGDVRLAEDANQVVAVDDR